jgi:hypothetical protein
MNSELYILKLVITTITKSNLTILQLATSHNDLSNLLQDLLYGENDIVLKMMILCCFDSYSMEQ